MPSLFAREFQTSDTRVARGVSGAISLSAQVLLGLAVLTLSTMASPEVARSPLVRPRFVSAVFLPTPVVETPVPELPRPAPRAVEAVKIPEPAPELPPLIAVHEFENKALPAPAADEVRPVDVAPRPEPSSPAPPPPAPTLGAFPNAATVARAPEPVKQVAATGFDAAVVHAAATRPSQNAVIESGFNISAAAEPTQQSRMIRESGFGTADSRERPKAQDRSPIQQSGFSDARIAEPVRRAEAAVHAPAVVPVQVLSKPTPTYTDEARRLKVEGEVVLEVEFCATGSVRIVRVVRSLGHGLDESATVAAGKIQFKPATSGGRPVDYRTTVQIVFRLA